MDINLTQGAVEDLVEGRPVNDPVLQLVDTLQITKGSGPTRYRVRMSDGRHLWSAFLLATQLNHLSEENLLVPHCVCLLKKTTTSTLSDGRRVVIILDMEILQSAEKSGGLIGNPTTYKEKIQGSAAFVWFAPLLWCKVIITRVFSPRWTIRARVMNKSSIRTWNNSRGEGKLFSFEIVDESGEMKITAFNKEVDKFFSLVEQGKVYYISKATLKVANKQYNTLKHDYEMTLHAHSSIMPCADGQDIPAVQCDFVPIAELENRDKDAIIDVIGVCKTAEDVSRITTKSSREVSKRTLHLIDTTGKMVAATLWGEEAEKFEGSEQPVVAIKGARLSDFGGRSLSALFSSTVMVNPDIPEAFRLRLSLLGVLLLIQGFKDCMCRRDFSLRVLICRFDSTSAHFPALPEASPADFLPSDTPEYNSFISRHDLISLLSPHYGILSSQADYFSCVATLLYSRKDTCLYRACPSVDCNKKVLDQHNGWFRCEKCNREFPNFKYRLLLSANLADFGDNQWVTCFQETAEALLGHSAETLGQLRDTDEAAFDAVFQKANFTTHIFKNRVKLETYNDESRVKVTVMEVQPVNHREYSRMLLSNIHNLIQ
uniref:Replication protein A 70 kDa DNA-binding subunit n=1 Tax=Takifugu rubripes TaxID=31033 RepID=A0A674P4S7_TAKRU